MDIHWKIGVEIELLAPLGKDRRLLAESLAFKIDGRVESFFHPDAEPSKVPGKRLFYNLTPAFAVFDKSEHKIAHFVDDITLLNDLDRKAISKKGWFRIVSDDPRLLRLASRYSNPDLSVEESLIALGHIFGTQPLMNNDGMSRLADEKGASIAITAPLPGERERPCEIVTMPISSDHANTLNTILNTAKEEGFLIPQEGALHIHFDATKLCSARTLLNLVNLLEPYRLLLRRLVGTNKSCRRLGAWSPQLLQIVREPSFLTLDWADVLKKFLELKDLKRVITKYCDFNIRNLLFPTGEKHTLEIRIFPVTMDTALILDMAGLFEGILRRACQDELVTDLEPEFWREDATQIFLSKLDLDSELRARWLERAKKRLKDINKD